MLSLSAPHPRVSWLTLSLSEWPYYTLRVPTRPPVSQMQKLALSLAAPEEFSEAQHIVCLGGLRGM